MNGSGLELIFLADERLAFGELRNMLEKFSTRLTVERGEDGVYGVEMDWRGFRVFLKDVSLSEMEDAILSIYSFFMGLGGRFFTRERYGFLRWEENSCFMDSLLFCLFVSKAGRNICREIERSKPLFSRSICNFVFADKKEFEPFFLSVKNIFLETMEKFLSGETGTSSSLRRVLAEVYPLKDRNTYVSYNVYDLYFHISEIFSLKEAHSFSSFLCEEGWKDGEEPYLAFYNTGAPRIKNLGKTGEEIVRWKDTESVIYKIRAFGKEIVNYSLSAVVFLTGVTLEGGGNHYFCYAKDCRSKVYLFDGTGAKGKRVVEDFPPDTFEEGYNFPAMYLYHSNHKI